MSQPPKVRSARAIANDAAIRDAGIQELLAVGIDRVSLRGVSARAGLTHGATYARYEDANELLVDLWNSRLEVLATRLFTLCERAVREPGEGSLGDLFEYINGATNADVASLHLVLSARRIPILLEEVEPFINRYLRAENCRSLSVSAKFTRTLCLYGVAIAEMLYRFHVNGTSDYHRELMTWLLEALGTDPSLVPIIDTTSPTKPFLEERGTDLRSSLALATYQVVGKSGYTHATVSRIARRANCSPGAIYNIFNSKEELVADSYFTALRSRLGNVSEFAHYLEEGELAQSLYETSYEINAVWRDYLLEFSLATAFNAHLFRAMAYQVQQANVAIPFLDGTSEEQRAVLSHLIMVLRLVTLGISFVTSVSGEMQCTNFAQFTEPLRMAMLNSTGSEWSKLSAQLRSLEDVPDLSSLLGSAAD